MRAANEAKGNTDEKRNIMKEKKKKENTRIKAGRMGELLADLGGTISLAQFSPGAGTDVQL